MVEKIITLGFVLALTVIHGQSQDGPYEPAEGTGSIGVHRDSVIVEQWLSDVDVVRGYLNIADKSAGFASAGSDQNATGKADAFTVSLGDSGYATYTLPQPLSNRAGYDFAVFENGFYSPMDGVYYLELAFVEVSSDGENFVRFPAHSLTQADSQKWTYGVLDPTQLNNLAGKNTTHNGTPFDLSDLQSDSALDIDNITHIRVLDVVGSIDQAYGSTDTAGNIINDPYPTEFAAGGFDLDAVAILNESLVGRESVPAKPKTFIYPNPAAEFISVKGLTGKFKVFNTHGQAVLKGNYNGGKINLNELAPGVYFIEFYQGKKQTFRFVKE
ncbi:T9SS type A sorting domain-containing protein [Salibacter sp.]|uniref:T9SS type A sorting domain-containing protein n=1 Tax=Salibacter sp. TaxID=2010995 RepID=UPI0028705771|nr:T9SS type A sorting domain-containing protein [Salibacter sp.]MDR9487617.1 T9SS type A sorting domain-containing protein [Salibacter sp.]